MWLGWVVRGRQMRDFNKLRLILDCRFQPDSQLFNLVMNLVSREGLSSKRFVLTRQMFFDRAVFNQ